jgi:hypothetical protein
MLKGTIEQSFGSVNGFQAKIDRYEIVFSASDSSEYYILTGGKRIKKFSDFGVAVRYIKDLLQAEKRIAENSQKKFNPLT